MHVLIIGGTGFIGPYVARELSGRGIEVTVFHRGQKESPLLPATVRHLRSEHAGMPVRTFPPELLHFDFDAVIHMIAVGEADARAAVEAFTGRAQRLIVLSSGDVYRAYGRFIGLEPGPVEEGLLTEDSPLRTVLFPYRGQAKSPKDLNHFYEKILVEQNLLGQTQLPGTVLRLPKVYGPEGNANLDTVYGYRDQPQWRWTHGYVENVAAAIVLAALHPAAANRIYHVGEAYTPTVSERLQQLPARKPAPARPGHYNFRQNIAYDTTRIRTELGYQEPVSYEEALKRTLEVSQLQAPNMSDASHC
jgi:nucleoside-diphosphate-sugar epimerase